MRRAVWLFAALGCSSGASAPRDASAIRDAPPDAAAIPDAAPDACARTLLVDVVMHCLPEHTTCGCMDGRLSGAFAPGTAEAVSHATTRCTGLIATGHEEMALPIPIAAIPGPCQLSFIGSRGAPFDLRGSSTVAISDPTGCLSTALHVCEVALAIDAGASPCPP